MNEKLFISAAFAGIFISLGAVAATTASFAITNISLAKLISGCIFPVGLMMVVVLNCDLFTGKCLLFSDLIEGRITPNALGKKLLTIYIGNLVGALLVAGLVYLSGNFDIGHGRVGLYAAQIAYSKSKLSMLNMLCSGILCNMLVCLAVLMTKKGHEPISKIFAAFFPILAFVASGFEHSVANMYYLSVGFIAAIGYHAPFEISFLDILLNLGIVTIGNIIGGLVVALGMLCVDSKS